MTAHTAVGIDDDLTAGQARITHGATNDETTSWVDQVLNVLSTKILGNNGLDNRINHRIT